MNIKSLIKCLYTRYCTKRSLKRVKDHGKGIKVNFPSHFSNNTIIGNNCHFNGLTVYGDGKVSIGDNFHSGKDIQIQTNVHNYDMGSKLPYDETYITKDVIIEDNVWLGQSIIILGGVTIGEGAIIQAGSVVCKSIPPLAIAGGHPAVPFKYRNKEHYYQLKAEKQFF